MAQEEKYKKKMKKYWVLPKKGTLQFSGKKWTIVSTGDEALKPNFTGIVYPPILDSDMQKVFQEKEREVISETVANIDLILGFELQKYKETKLKP